MCSCLFVRYVNSEIVTIFKQVTIGISSFNKIIICADSITSDVLIEFPICIQVFKHDSSFTSNVTKYIQ